LRIVFSALLLCICAAAQDTWSRHEVGASGNFLQAGSFNRDLGGFEVRYDYNVGPELALETSFAVYPQSATLVANEGGRSFSWFAGPKVGMRRKRWGLYGKAMPGLRHFTSVPEFRVDSISPLQVSRITMGRTHFALQLGGVFEVYPTSRWIVRTDVGEVLSRYGTGPKLPEIVTPDSVAIFGFAPGVVHSSLSVSAGFGYRFGQAREQLTVAPSHYRRLEAGAQYALWNRSHAEFEMMDDSGVGVWGSFYLNRHVALDGACTRFWERRFLIEPQQGGNSLSTLFGAKVGITHERFGAYAKVRPGFVRFADAMRDQQAFVATRHGQPATQFAIDVGGVLEFYPKQHLVMRFDLSDLTIHYASRTTTYIFGPPFHWPGYTASTILSSFGVGWRF
jgi:hypothetical protein